MTQPVNVRGLDMVLWRRFRAAAVVRNVPVGELLNEIIRSWLELHDRLPQKMGGTD